MTQRLPTNALKYSNYLNPNPKSLENKKERKEKQNINHINSKSVIYSPPSNLSNCRANQGQSFPPPSLPLPNYSRSNDRGDKDRAKGAALRGDDFRVEFSPGRYNWTSFAYVRNSCEFEPNRATIAL